MDVVAGLGTFGTEAWHGVDEDYVFLLGEAPEVGEVVVVLVVADYRLVAPLSSCLSTSFLLVLI